MEIQKDLKQVLELKDEDIDSQSNYYLSGLFNIETSPGFKVLESLRNTISEERIQKYKEEFTKLHSFLLSMHNHQKGMVEHLRSTLQEVTLAKLEQDRAISQQFSGNAEIGELKRELLKQQNEVDMALEREQKLQLDMEDVLKTKQDLVHDIEEIRRHKADLLEPQLIAATKELKMELLQRKHQIENLQKDLEEKQGALDSILVERDRAESEKEKHSISLAKASETPIKIQKQIDVLKDAITALQGEHTKQITIVASLDKEIERLGKKKKDLEEQRLSQSAAYEERRGLISQMERQVDDIFKEHELAKEQLAFQKAERVRLDLGMRRTIQDIKREHDLVLRVIREKDTYLKYYRRLELTVNNIKMSTPTTMKQGEELKRQLKAMKADEVFYRKEVVRLKQSIDVNTLEFLKQDKFEKIELDALEEQREVNLKCDIALDEALKEAAESAKAVEALTIEKDMKLRDVIRAGTRLRSVKNDNIAQEITLVDASKRCQETANRVKEFMSLYELVKNEKNKYLNQIHSASQRVQEMKERIKILSNEIEILRHEISNKDRELARKKQENSAAYAVRDSLRNEANKLMHQYRDKRDQIDHRLSRIETLNSNINNAEQHMLRLKEKYEQSVKDRNQAGVQLLDRNDELCILYERINVQKEVLARGASALAEREDEIKRLELIKAGLSRKLELEKQKKPMVHEYQKEIYKLEKERDVLEEKVKILSKEIENPDDPKRIRNLAGEDPDQEQLTKKIEKLEALLASQEEKILEKDLVLEEVSQLAERLRNQTEETKDETYQHTFELCELNKKIKNVTKKTMAKVSELAMNQATAMSLYREKSEKECLLKESLEKLEVGEIPIGQIEADFIQAEKRRIQRQNQIEEIRRKKELEASGRLVEMDDAFYLHGGVKTTAEPRPNAYIPEPSAVGQLPIPKPYGENSPFRPQEPGAQLRHYRKPVIKPIEI